MEKTRTDGIAGWKEERNIGSGGFGTVSLWRHEEHNCCVALKKCRVSNEMSARHKERWAREIDIMLRLDHPNVVNALEIPKELTVLQDELPLLCMEYCSGGDLRKVLNLPSNCCGLPEYQVRALIHDVASGIEYLHQTRIIHRDLKPENIVLQKVDDKYVYKIIDLGYAKDLDQGSVCTSFVGTLQYLAPELFSSERYTCTVDYWSFGILVFECIVGYRPFLPELNPFQWHQETVKKGDDHICIYYNGRSEIQYSKTIPQPNYLCRNTKMYLEKWLRLMLLWDPRSRGGGLEETPSTSNFPGSKRPKCFNMLDTILQLKLVFVLSVPTGQLLTYQVTESYSLADLQLVLEQETKITVMEQELLLASGISPDPQKPAVQCCNAEMGEEEWLVFLFRKNSTTFSEQARKPRAIPDAVQAMAREPKVALTYRDQRRVWGHALYFVGEVAKDYRRLLQGQRAAMMSLLRGNSSFSKLKNKLQADFTQLQAQAEFFKHGLSYDINKYHDQSAQGISSQKLQTSWKKMEEESNRYLSMKDEVNALDQRCHALSTRVVELQRSPFAKMKRTDPLDGFESEARQYYENLRQIPKEQRHMASDNSPMVQSVIRCVTHRDRLTNQLYLHLGKIATCKLELEGLNPKLDDLVGQINEASSRLLTLQHQRQNDMWTLLRVTLKQTQSLSVATNAGQVAQPSGATSLTSSALPVHSSTGPQGGMASMDPQSIGSASFLSSMVEKSSMESHAVLNENQNIKSKLVQLMHNLKDEHTRSMSELHSLDWSFVTSQSATPQPVSMVSQQPFYSTPLYLTQPQTYTGPSDSMYNTTTLGFNQANQPQQQQQQQLYAAQVYNQQGYYQQQEQLYGPKLTNPPAVMQGSPPISSIIQQRPASATPPHPSQSPVSWTAQHKPANPQVIAPQSAAVPRRVATPSPPTGVGYSSPSLASPQLSATLPKPPTQTGSPQRSLQQRQLLQTSQCSTGFVSTFENTPVYTGHAQCQPQNIILSQKQPHTGCQTQQSFYLHDNGGHILAAPASVSQVYTGISQMMGTARKIPPKIPPRITSAAGSGS